MDNNFQKNIIIVGLTGSGKDTIADDLVYNSDYFKLRIAGTIKQIICEKHELSETELEEVKRTNPVIDKNIMILVLKWIVLTELQIELN